MGLLEVELLSVLGVTGIAVLNAVSFTESLPFPGGCCIGDQCGPEAKWCMDGLCQVSFQKQVACSEQCADRIPCLQPVIDKFVAQWSTFN